MNPVPFGSGGPLATCRSCERPYSGRFVWCVFDQARLAADYAAAGMPPEEIAEVLADLEDGWVDFNGHLDGYSPTFGDCACCFIVDQTAADDRCYQIRHYAAPLAEAP